jgi:cysteine desulfuration protein SufE
MFESCLKKQQAIKDIFNACLTKEARYAKIMELGRRQPPLDAQNKTIQNIVKGCQSVVYLHASLSDNKVLFEAESDALISSGLAALLIMVYSGEPPEVILKCPPSYLEELGIGAGLTPNRANGLYSIHLRMKQDALKLLIEKEKQNKMCDESGGVQFY